VKPSRVNPDSFPVSATATAHAYDFATETETAEAPASANPSAEAGQQALFANPNPSRVVPFESLTSPVERESIRARAAEAQRPEPVKQAKVEVRHARAGKKTSLAQQRLDFFGKEEVVSLPQSHIICDAPVAPASLRAEAGLVDGLIMLTPALAGLALFLYEGGSLSFDKHVAPFWLVAVLTVPVLYKLLWTVAGRDTIGMSVAGVRLVDFDGNPPSRERRYQRLFGSFLSALAGGIGLIWALVDEDGLTWHDHMSSTFPTIASENF
jgi:uncharacterized RDD family membrane protein YckC